MNELSIHHVTSFQIKAHSRPSSAINPKGIFWRELTVRASNGEFAIALFGDGELPVIEMMAEEAPGAAGAQLQAPCRETGIRQLSRQPNQNKT